MQWKCIFYQWKNTGYLFHSERVYDGFELCTMKLQIKIHPYGSVLHAKIILTNSQRFLKDWLVLLEKKEIPNAYNYPQGCENRATVTIFKLWKEFDRAQRFNAWALGP